MTLPHDQPVHPCQGVGWSSPWASLPCRVAGQRVAFRMRTFLCPGEGREHAVLVLGDPQGQDVLVRVHSECLTGDVFHSLRCDCGGQLEGALEAIARGGRGVLVYLAHEGRGIGLSNKLRAYDLQSHGADTAEAHQLLGLPVDARSFTAAVCVLAALGVGSVRLLTNNPAKSDALRAEGLALGEDIPLETPVCEDNASYLQTKRDAFGHFRPRTRGAASPRTAQRSPP